MISKLGVNVQILIRLDANEFESNISAELASPDEFDQNFVAMHMKQNLLQLLILLQIDHNVGIPG